MADVLACPACRGQFPLPGDYHLEIVRCPLCGAEFALPAVLPATATVARPARPAGRRYDRFREVSERPRVKSSGKPWLIALGVLGGVGLLTLLVAIGAGLVVARSRAGARPSRSVAWADVDDEPAVVRPPAADRLPLTEADITREVTPLFEDLGAALRAADSARIMSHFDVERLADEAAPLTKTPRRGGRQRRDLLKAVGANLTTFLLEGAPVYQWKTFKITNIVKLNDDEAFVVVHTPVPSGMTVRMRWWVTRRGGGWKIYDRENVQLGGRTSYLVAAFTERFFLADPEVGGAVKTLNDALNAMAVKRDTATAEQKLRQVAAVTLPAPLEAQRCQVQCRIELWRGQYQKAVDASDRGIALGQDLPVLDFLRAIALNRLNKYAPALTELDAHLARYGEQWEACSERGFALRGLSRFPEAARCYRQSLDLDPKNGDSFLGLLRSLDGTDAADLGDRFARLDKPREHFDACAADCVTRHQPGLLEPLLAAMRKLEPDYPPLLFYSALRKAWAGQAAEAVPLFQSALRRQDDAGKQFHYTQDFLQALAGAGKVREAYAAVPDGDQAFRILAPDLHPLYRRHELKQLVAAHAAKHADDPLLPWYQGTVYVREGRYALADQTFTAAQAHAPDEATRALVRADRVLARYHTGQALAAYRDIGPRQETFEQLANLFLQDRKDDQLQTLLDAHAKNEPDSVAVLQFGYRVKFRQQEPAAGVALFQAALKKTLTDEKRTEIVNDFLMSALESDQMLAGYRAAPDTAAAFRIVADELLEGSRAADLSNLLEVHRRAHTADPALPFYQGEVYLIQKEWGEAAQVLADGFKAAPADLRDRFRWQCVYAHYKAGLSLRAYAEFPPRDQTFTALANLFVQDKDGTGLESLLAARRPLAGDDAESAYFGARAKLFLKQPAAATALFQQAYRQQTDERLRAGYRTGLLPDLAEQVGAPAAYRAAPDKAAAFTSLAPWLVTHKKDVDLAALLDEQGRGRAAEPLGEFYRGELHLLRGQVREADRHFTAAFALGKDLLLEQWRLRNGLFRARVKAGKAVATYREVEPGPLTFGQLASLCVEEKDAKQLQALIDVHRASYPDDPNLLVRALEVPWLNKDYEGVLKALDAPHEVPETEGYYWRLKAGDYRVRCLVKLGRTAEAIQVAEDQLKKQTGSTLVLILAHAATGDVRQTLAELEKERPYPYLLKNCYDDADLGPLLRSEAFRAVREQFPPPE